MAVHKLPHPTGGAEPQSQDELLALSIQPIVSFVVICSILVHGLSIPFFSLGKRVRTVSRTWSRPSTAADWTTLTRRVSKAEDIIINRDIHDQVERGEATPTTTIHEKEGILLSNHPTVTEKPVGNGIPTMNTGENDGRGETGPTAGNLVVLNEWREGPHQVIERQTSSSGEVEVEVRRNVYAPENSERMTSRFVGGESEVRTAVLDYLHWLKEDTHKHAEGLVVGLKSAEAELKRHLNPKVHHNSPLSSQLAVEEVSPSPSELVEEGGWVSDDSKTRTSRPTKTKSLGGKTTRSFKRRGSGKTKKPIRPSTAPTPSTPRTHPRVREGRSSSPSSQPYPLQRRTGVPISRTASWDLASPYHSRSNSLLPDSRKGSVWNLRIESLRSAGMPGSPRELSPARSVRFVDSHPSRTPPYSQDTPGASTSQLGLGQGDQEEASSVFTRPADRTRPSRP